MNADYAECDRLTAEEFENIGSGSWGQIVRWLITFDIGKTEISKLSKSVVTDNVAKAILMELYSVMWAQDANPALLETTKNLISYINCVTKKMNAEVQEENHDNHRHKDSFYGVG